MGTIRGINLIFAQFIWLHEADRPLIAGTVFKSFLAVDLSHMSPKMKAQLHEEFSSVHQIICIIGYSLDLKNPNA